MLITNKSGGVIAEVRSAGVRPRRGVSGQWVFEAQTDEHRYMDADEAKTALTALTRRAKSIANALAKHPGAALFPSQSRGIEVGMHGSADKTFYLYYTVLFRWSGSKAEVKRLGDKLAARAYKD